MKRRKTSKSVKKQEVSATPTTMKKPHEKKALIPLTKNQKIYLDSIRNNDITICTGPAGSGKTAVPVSIACEYLMSGRVDRIIITRPVIESGRGLGFLPGSMLEKINPYMVPVLEEMQKYLSSDMITQYRNDKAIEICPLEYMRGRNFHNSFMILDEAQNCTFEQIKMFITRIGKASKAVINGDVTQSDLPEYTKNGFSFVKDVLKDMSGVAICGLNKSDIQRNGIISSILERFENAPV